jgi:hypothetical protein
VQRERLNQLTLLNKSDGLKGRKFVLTGMSEIFMVAGGFAASFGCL